MKKKYVIIGLVVLGLALVLAGILLALRETAHMDIIGGSESMWSFVFFRSHHGIYATLALVGVACWVSGLVIGLWKGR